jgi:hypothetical protein
VLLDPTGAPQRGAVRPEHADLHRSSWGRIGQRHGLLEQGQGGTRRHEAGLPAQGERQAGL